jgi:hypothetical protein
VALEADFLDVAFLAAVFFAGAFLAAVFFAVVFLAAVFFTAVFLAAVFFVVAPCFLVAIMFETEYRTFVCNGSPFSFPSRFASKIGPKQRLQCVK